ncbi:O-linked N-acetylglucosamine transferase, SPINDLY family protein [Roseobacteraceae bacterium NS-SX3]
MQRSAPQSSGFGHHAVGMPAALQPAAAQADALYAEAVKHIVRTEPAQAEALLKQAIALAPAGHKLHAQMAEVQQMLGRQNLALLSLMEAFKLDPGNSDYQMNIGTFLMRIGKDAEAAGFFELAVQTDPKNAMALARLLFLQMRRCDWRAFEGLDKKLKVLDTPRIKSDPFMLLPLADDPGFHKRRSVAMARALECTAQPARPRPAAGEKIRIGYFSNDFHNHATMFLMARLLELHDKNRFEVFLYDYGKATGDAAQRRAEAAADCHRRVAAASDAEIAAQARQDGIHVAIDLKGYTQGNRLGIFAHRAAPVQVSYLGYPGTTGLRQMDYLVADPVVIPANMRGHYSEKILWMPDSYQVNDDSRSMPEAGPSRGALGLPEEGVVFCSFNNPYKTGPEEFALWARLLREVPDSVLWLLAPEEAQRQNLRQAAAGLGAAPERLVFADRVPMEAHLARLPAADLFLDTFRYNAHTTASEALWAGVPVVTMAGNQFAARVAASLLTAAGFEELIAQTPCGYFDVALQLARDAEARGRLKHRLRETVRTGSLYDTARFTRNFEALLEKAWQRHQSGKRPGHLSLS